MHDSLYSARKKNFHRNLTSFEIRQFSCKVAYEYLRATAVYYLQWKYCMGRSLKYRDAVHAIMAD